MSKIEKAAEGHKRQRAHMQPTLAVFTLRANLKTASSNSQFNIFIAKRASSVQPMTDKQLLLFESAQIRLRLNLTPSLSTILSLALCYCRRSLTSSDSMPNALH